MFSTAQEISYGENSQLEISQDNPTKLYVVNLPWTLSAPDVKKIFSLSGSVNGVEDLQGRTIRVEFAKSIKKPPPCQPESTEVKETSCKLYESNLAWKVRSSHLREFFAASFKPLSAKVVFDNPSGRSAVTIKEEAEAAISAFNEKELMVGQSI